MDDHKISLEDLCKKFDTDLKDGLTAARA